jgi:hypothetical protein
VAGGHFIARERAGLVGTDHRDRAERLDGVELAGDGVAPGHALHAERQRDGENGRQAFGNRGDGETDGGEEQLAGGEVMQQPAREDHINTAMPTMTMERILPKRFICRVSGVASVCTSEIILLMRPSSVAGPVAVTTPVPRPAATIVPE